MSLVWRIKNNVAEESGLLGYHENGQYRHVDDKMIAVITWNYVGLGPNTMILCTRSVPSDRALCKNIRPAGAYCHV